MPDSNFGYRSNYKFVPFTKPSYYFPQSEERYHGYIDVNIICDEDVHIGSGYKDFTDNSNIMVNETFKRDGKLIIPGSSLKGAVRTVASAVSDGCLPDAVRVKVNKRETDPDKIKYKFALPSNMEGWRVFECKVKEHCVICDMFGMMGFASKVVFPEFTSQNATALPNMVNKPFSPQKTTNKDGIPGYKFYRINVNDVSDTGEQIKVEFIAKGSVFSGRIFFKQLTKKELELLMFSLGLDGTIHLKIGGYKNDGYGEVHLEATSFECNEITEKPSQLAADYAKNPMNYDCRDSIKYLTEILAPEG